jgi:hypothetical protein
MACRQELRNKNGAEIAGATGDEDFFEVGIFHE